MKNKSIIISLILVFIIIYLSSCNYSIDGNKEIISQSDNFECVSDSNKCGIPSYCNNGHGKHICLNIFYKDTEEEFDYETIYKVLVTHVGKDCNNNDYYCSYVTTGSSPTGMGCVLPWCSNYCSYRRTVCLQTTDNKTYTGYRDFQYYNYNGATVAVYETQTQCDFGGSSRQNK